MMRLALLLAVTAAAVAGIGTACDSVRIVGAGVMVAAVAGIVGAVAAARGAL